MDKQSLFDRPSLQHHRRDRFWQIILPIVLVILGIGTVAGFTLNAGESVYRNWADISIIWLVTPLLILALLLLAVLAGLIYLLMRLAKGIPRITGRVQTFFFRFEIASHRIADSSVKPVFWIHQFRSGLKSLLDKVNPGK